MLECVSAGLGDLATFWQQSHAHAIDATEQRDVLSCRYDCLHHVVGQTRSQKLRESYPNPLSSSRRSRSLRADTRLKATPSAVIGPMYAFSPSRRPIPFNTASAICAFPSSRAASKASNAFDWRCSSRESPADRSSDRLVLREGQTQHRRASCEPSNGERQRQKLLE